MYLDVSQPKRHCTPSETYILTLILCCWLCLLCLTSGALVPLKALVKKESHSTKLSFDSFWHNGFSFALSTSLPESDWKGHSAPRVLTTFTYLSVIRPNATKIQCSKFSPLIVFRLFDHKKTVCSCFGVRVLNPSLTRKRNALCAWHSPGITQYALGLYFQRPWRDRFLSFKEWNTVSFMMQSRSLVRTFRTTIDDTSLSPWQISRTPVGQTRV